MTTKTTKIVLFVFLMLSIQVKAIKHVVEVGPGGQNIFSPATIPGVVVGDIIRWEWKAGNHTTTSMAVPTGAATWDSPINSTVTFYEYTVTVAGNYGYICTPHAGMNMVGGFVATSAAGIPDGIKEGFLLFPNPATDLINIFFPYAIPANTVISICNIQGQEIITEQVAGIGTNKMTVPFTMQPAGIYFVRIREAHKNYMLRVIKQ